MNEQLPQMIGRYQIRAELGRGGMATVYRAHDPRFGRDVALKVLPAAFMHDPTFRSRFEREARTIAALEHVAIVPVYDFGEHNGQPYLVMRLMSGGSLADRLARGPMSPGVAARVLHRIGAALDKAHSQGVVHRDLKPANILFDQDGNAFLSDFGIVKLSESTAALTGSNIIGTPAYMSPEQAKGEGNIDGRSDIYALGAIVFEMLTGEQPYKADTPMGVVVKHITEPVPRVGEVRPDLASNYENIIGKAMAKEREARFPSGSEMSRAFSAAVGAGGRSGPQVTQATSQRPPVAAADGERRRAVPVWAWLGGAALLLCLLAATVAGAYLLLGDDEATPTVIVQTTASATSGSVSENTATASATAQSATASSTATQPPATATSTPSPLPPTSTPTIPAPTGPGEAAAVQLAVPPQIDGQLDEWTGVAAAESTFLVFSDTSWDGSRDLTASWRLAWDSANLYLAVEVSDNLHVQSQSGNSLFLGDSLEMQIDTDLNGDYGPSLSPDDFQILLSPGDFAALPPSAFRLQGNNQGQIVDAPGHSIFVAAQPVSGGYILEARIPWSDLNLAPLPGRILGLALNVNDNDRPGAAVQEIMLSNVAGRTLTDPTSWGTLTLR